MCLFYLFCFDSISEIKDIWQLFSDVILTDASFVFLLALKRVL